MSTKKTIVKAEKGEKAAVCVKGLTGKDLANKVNYKLKQAPEWIRMYWTGKVKYDKSSSSAEKKECIEAILSDKGWDAPFFQRLRSVNKVDEDKTDSTWMSWKKLLENEDEAVAKLMIAQHKILTRNHELLDHNDDATKELPENLRLQYKYALVVLG